MRRLGHDRFAVIGHDRGALVAYRAALDHPEAVARVGTGGVFAFHLYLLAQPTDIAERMISANPDASHGHPLVCPTSG